MWELSAKLESCLDNIKRQKNNEIFHMMMRAQPEHIYSDRETVRAQCCVEKPGINFTLNVIC